MRIIGILLLAAVVLYGATIAYLAAYQRHLIYPGAYDPPRQDRALPDGIEGFVLLTEDGQRLHALWRAPRDGCGIVVSFHGNGSLPEPHAARFAGPPWREAGWGALAIAYRGYPGSSGTPSEPGLIEDGMAAYRYARDRAPEAPILLHGHSLGSAVAVAVAEKEEHLGLYLEAPFDALSSAAKLHMPYVPTGLFLLDTYRSDRRIAGGSRPVFIVQGDRDDIVPEALARALAEAAGARARIEVIAGDHVSILGARDREAEAFFRALVPRACAGDPDAATR